MLNMKRTLLFLLLSSFYFLQAQQTKKVLFIGNSYTYYNQLPVLIDNLANANGNDIIHDSSTPGGYSLSQHAGNATTLNKIKAQDWDYVVIQAQSQEPSFSPGQVASNTYPSASILNDSILANNPCTEPLFFMTWGRKNGDASNCAAYPPICTYDGMQQRLRESYLEMALVNIASSAPVGVAWKTVRDLYPLIELYNPDESHPSLAGSYLAACVFYASIFRESAVGNTFISTLDSLTAFRLQTIASATVLDSLSLWHIGDNDLSLSLPADTSFCGDSLTITAQNVMGNLWWSTSETTPTITLTNSALVMASVSNLRTCNISDSMNVNLSSGVTTTLNYEACDSFEWNGVVYREDTILTETFVLGNGCDSVLSREIRIRELLDISASFYEFNNDSAYVFIENGDFDSIYIYNNVTGDFVINQDTMHFLCTFVGYALVWNSCGMDSVYLNTVCGAIQELDDSWIIGPNPANDLIQISNSDNLSFAYILYNYLGQVVLESTYNDLSHQNITLANLSKGNYFTVLSNKDGSILGRKTIQKQ
jgi:hypothetical protein